MSRADRNAGMLPSVLDRLIDADSNGAGGLLGYDLARMTDAVRRDLEELLNTRQSHQGMPESFVELHRSIAAYGLPDFSSIDAARDGQVRSMGQAIERVITLFEPRLREVRAVAVDDPDAKAAKKVRFRIDARLWLEPSPEVGFETVVELLSGHASVRPRED